jgi:hypothetical protein
MTHRSWLCWLWTAAVASLVVGLAGLGLTYALFGDLHGAPSLVFGPLYLAGWTLLPLAFTATAAKRIGSSAPLRQRIVLVIALLAAVSVYPLVSTIATCRCCLWTTGGKYSDIFCSQSKSTAVPQGAYFYGDLSSFKAGHNDNTTDETKDYRWLRVRLGVPLQAITIDVARDMAEWHMYLEGWFWVNLVLWFALWILYQAVGKIYRRIKRRYEVHAL